MLNVLNHGLLLGPAERADVVVDFSQFAGKTLILYNDGPAPVPASDPRVDYYTGSPDQTTSGGAPSTLPGYGPNTRTIMQVKVKASGATAPFNVAALATAQPAIFASTQDPIIVPQPAYPPANGGTTAANYARISDNALAWWNGGGISALTLGAAGTGYTAPATVTRGKGSRSEDALPNAPSAEPGVSSTVAGRRLKICSALAFTSAAHT